MWSPQVNLTSIFPRYSSDFCSDIYRNVGNDSCSATDADEGHALVQIPAVFQSATQTCQSLAYLHHPFSNSPPSILIETQFICTEKKT